MRIGRFGSRSGPWAVAVLGWALGTAPALGSGETVMLTVGDLPPGKVVIVRVQATVDAQSNTLLPVVSNQASITATGLGSPVLSDDPLDPTSNADPTVTLLDELILGDRVFVDGNGNAAFDPGEGVAGVAVTLFADDGGTPGALDGTDTQLATGSSVVDGLYAFGNLAPGDYIVRVDASNFGAGQPLENHSSLPGAPDPDDNVDHDDNGEDVVAPATTGVPSKAITLAYNTETTPGTGNDTNPTLDFGFVLGPDIEVTKTESADPVIAGDATPGNLVYTVTAENVGAVAATGVEVTETLTLPAGVTVDSVAASAGTSVAGTNPYTWTVGGLAPAASATLTVTLTVAADTADGATVSDTAEVTALNELDANASNDSVTESTTVVRRVDIEVVKTDTPDPVVAGKDVPENLVHEVTVTNNGPSDATGVVVNEALATLPAGVTLDSVIPSGSTTYAPPNAGTGTWTVGDLAAGDSETLTLVLTVAANAAAGVDVVSNTATQAAVNETDTNLTNGTATEKTSIVREVDLVITKTDGPDPVVAGSQLVYTIEVENLGPSDASSVVVTESLPAEVASPSTSGCAEDPGGVPTCTLGTIAAGGSASYTVTVTVDPGTASGTITNDASVTAAEPLVNTGDDSTSEDTEVIGDFDYGDAPDPLVATAGSYPTLDANGGARHALAGTLFLGAVIDAEADGQPTPAADGDDLTGSDDEDGVTFVTSMPAGGTAQVEVVTTGAGLLNAWVDFDGDGDWTDPGEQIFTDEAIAAAGTHTLAFAVPAGALSSPAVEALGGTFARFRLDSGGGLAPGGQADDGEVEDYFVAIEHDYGDAPDPTYPTLDASDGARHLQPSALALGVLVDVDTDGQPTPGADGDDLDGNDDEDGVELTSLVVAAADATVEVTATDAGLLNAWIDFNGDGDWADGDEQIFTDEPLAAGANALGFAVPAAAVPGPTFARFRLATAGGLSFDGAADDGEVEDYAIDVEAASADLGVSVSASPDPAEAHTVLLYEITVTNDGPSDATAVTLEQELAAASYFLGAEPAAVPCTLSAGVALACDLGDLDDGDSTTVTVGVFLDGRFSGELVSEVSVSAAEGDPDTSNNETESEVDVARARSLLATNRSDGTPVVATVAKEADEYVGLVVAEAATGSGRDYALAGDGVRTVALAEMPDFAGTPAPEIAALGFGFDGSTTVFVFDADSMLPPLSELPVTFPVPAVPIDLAAVPDFGDSPAPELAILGSDVATGQTVLIVIDAGSGATLNSFTFDFADSGDFALGLATLPDFGGTASPDLAALVRTAGMGNTFLLPIDPAAGPIAPIPPAFATGLFPFDLSPVAELGATPAEDVAVLSRRVSDGALIATLVDPSVGVALGDVAFDPLLEPAEMETVPDFDGTPAPELAVLGRVGTDLVVEVRDAGNGVLLGAPTDAVPPAVPRPLGLAVHPDFGGLADPDLSVLFEFDADPAQIDAFDASSMVPFLTYGLP